MIPVSESTTVAHIYPPSLEFLLEEQLDPVDAMSSKAPEKADLLHHLATNRLYEVVETLRGEEYERFIQESESYVELLPDNEPAATVLPNRDTDHPDSIQGGAVVKPRDENYDDVEFVVRYRPFKGIKGRHFDLHKNSQEPTNQCSKCGSSLVGRNEYLEASVCADCGVRWADTTRTERTVRLATNSDHVALPEFSRAGRVDHVGTEGKITLGGVFGALWVEIGDDGYGVIDQYDGDSLDLEEGDGGLRIVHPDDPWR